MHKYISDFKSELITASSGDILWIQDVSDIASTAAGTIKKIAVRNLISSPREIQFTLGDGTNLIVTGSIATTRVSYDCVITTASIVSLDGAGAPVSGDIVIDLWKDTYANWPPDDADTITGGDEPTLVSSDKSQISDMASWSVTVSAGDYIIAHVDSVATVKQVILTLDVIT